MVHLKRWTRFFETFPVGPNRSIEFWTEISGNFGWMDRTQWPLVTFIFLVAYHFLFAMYSNLANVTFIFYLNSFFFYSPRWRFVLQTEISGKYNSPLYFCSLSLFFYHSSRCKDQFTVLSLRFDSFHLPDTLGREASGVLRWIAPNPTWKECQNWYIYNDISIICEVLIANHFSVSLLWSGGSAHVRIHIFPSSRFNVNSKWRSLIQRVFYFSIQSS